MDEGETVESAAIREAMEETGLAVELKELFYVYSDPSRDPRKHTISVVFIADANGTPRAADDAASVLVVPESELPNQTLVFDHGQIISDYTEYSRTGKRPLHL